MGDPVQPSEEAFKTVYEKGDRTWASLWERAAQDNRCPAQYMTSPWSAFPDHPYLPRGLLVDNNFSNTATVRGKTTWRTTRGSCGLPAFEDEVVLKIAANSPTTLAFVPNPAPTTTFPECLGIESSHIPILMLAWSYILSARWAELIPGAQPPDYSSLQARMNSESPSGREYDGNPVLVSVGDVSEDAARWWAAVLAPGLGYDAYIRSNTGAVLYSPWSLQVHPEPAFAISGNIRSQPSTSDHRSATFRTALRYLSEYCNLHDVSEQAEAALAAALLIPVAKFDNRRIEFPVQRLSSKETHVKGRTQSRQVWGGECRQLDRLLTMSSNSRGVKAILNSIFFYPEVACNVSGAWLQGSFAFLDSDKAKHTQTLLGTFMRRDPDIGFLWLGAFITGAQGRCLKEARLGWWKVDLSASSWTGTHASFIQDSVPKLDPASRDMSRANECRLTYLCHEKDHMTPPLFPFAPFGTTATEDTDVGVRSHADCSTPHGLEYDNFTWECSGGRKEQKKADTTTNTFRVKNGKQLALDAEMAVDYDGLDMEDEVSETVTRNIFTWLRGEAGFPVAERSIREHDWIDNLDSDDDSPIEGEARSSVARHLGGWLLEQATIESQSL